MADKFCSWLIFQGMAVLTKNLVTLNGARFLFGADLFSVLRIGFYYVNLIVNIYTYWEQCESAGCYCFYKGNVKGRVIEMKYHG
ncbi:MAG: hypothetical protein HQL21_05400 [Candidatus Omnitrophica bacterium]|nr:hypothetical protein [Candidatus Omnitrophota bacterium]